MRRMIEHLPGTRCPICGKNTVAVVGHAGGIPVTLCLTCDANRMMADMGLSRREIAWIRIRTWYTTLVEVGVVGALLSMVTALSLAGLALLPPAQEAARGACMILGMVATFVTFQLYVFPLGFGADDGDNR